MAVIHKLGFDSNNPLCTQLTVRDFSGNPALVPGDTEADFQAFCQSGSFLCDCSHPEYETLMAFYDATGGPNWLQNEGWKEGKEGTNCDPCTWMGVLCLSNDAIFSISLPSNNLRSDQTQDLLLDLKLENLISLNLSNNHLAGSIPDFVELPFLSIVHLWGNQLVGTIPDFSQVPFLRDLSLQQNSLQGSIPNFQNLPLLNTLSLSDNNLSGNIPNFENLPELEDLYLDNNALTGQIPNLSNCPDLEDLLLNENKLTGSLPKFNHISKLLELEISDNKLTGEIPDFANIPQLAILNLANNNLEGTIPSFSQLDNLIVLQLANNDLVGCYPEEWYSGSDSLCSRLIGYDFAGNPDLLPGDTPEDFE